MKTIKTTLFKEIFEQIQIYQNIVIARHIGADPDALASQLSLKKTLEIEFPTKKILAIGAYSNRFNYFPKLDKQEKLDNALLIVVDTPDKKRIDISNLEDYKKIIKIDHHPKIETYASIEYIDDKSSSCSEIIIDFIKETSLTMTKEIAEILFMGMISDTNRFLYSTNTKTLYEAANLIDKYNLDTTKLYSNIYTRPLAEIRLQGYIEQNMIVTENGLAYINLTNEILTNYKVDSSSAGNLINNLNNIAEVLTWVTISEDIKNNQIKINIRSRGPIINTIAEKYNGGGHKYASGARLHNKDDIDKLLNDLDEACRSYKGSD